jgi:hypothetical protein
MKNKEDFLDEALKVVIRDSADDFFYILIHHLSTVPSPH